MAVAVSQGILNWLHSVLTNYDDINRTYSDVVQLLQHYPNFSLRTDVYTFENGSSNLLLNAQGTLTVSFRGNNYGFPVSLWVLQDYPNSAPVAFVTPTRDMFVRPGQHVSAEGRVYHPYLANWRSDRSSLLGFFIFLQEIFAREPPVVARRHQAQSPTSAPQQSGAPPVPPLPPKSENVARQSTYADSPDQRSDPQLPPPKPPKAEEKVSSRYDKPAPLPPQKLELERRHGVSLPIQTNGQTPAQPLPDHQFLSHVRDPTWQQYSGQSTGYQPQQQAWQLNTEARSPVSPVKTYHSHTLPPPSQNHTQTLPHQQYQKPILSKSQPLITRPTIYDGSQTQSADLFQSPSATSRPAQPLKKKPPEDLLTSPFETAMLETVNNIAPPPIPPNPQKDALLSALSKTLTQQIQSTHAANNSAISPLLTQQRALNSTLEAISLEISQLNDLEKMLSSNEAILHQAMRDADKVLEDAKRRKVPNVDDVLVAPSIVAGQLYQAVAEERAIEDCRAVLGKALDKGRIGGGVWAKQTRSLAREEVLKKALIKKISKGMGLVEEMAWQ